MRDAGCGLNGHRYAPSALKLESAVNALRLAGSFARLLSTHQMHQVGQPASLGSHGWQRTLL